MKEIKDGNLFVAISAVIAVLTFIILLMQYRDRKELLAIEKELKKHELDQIKHNLA